ncbi:hypothetical protein GKE82_24365 [Conexibacter sp. W3-3-2]|uniref:helix-turn-helix domain-containing protein n=1 Tax=Conexibacter sp. W3-3-2 TaxID=2675227 RepID=UPI0012B851FB|nr:helix-turn-helix transcriptional regulator [Conexibacter sp. W3-3-2]MTD47344.1 hypothetical protein [Conexibacter sp. W3-3-2]
MPSIDLATAARSRRASALEALESPNVAHENAVRVLRLNYTGISLSDLSASTGVARARLTAIEQGAPCNDVTAYRVAAALGVRTTDVFALGRPVCGR